MNCSNEVAQSLPITVVILTKNEEETIRGAIASAIKDFAEVVVLDSFSTDKTVSISINAGARVVQHEFSGYASQRNFALSEMEKTTEWILFLDADERLTPELVLELKQDFLRKADSVGMFYLRRKDMFEGRWIKHSSGYPTWFGRLCHSSSVVIAREINEQYNCIRPTEKLQEHLLHYPFAKGLSHWISRHNEYSSAEAIAKSGVKEFQFRNTFSRDPGLRRTALKQLYMSLPFRPIVGFFYLYIIRGGFMDGQAGLRYSFLRSFYELMISIKLDENKEKQKGN